MREIVRSDPSSNTVIVRDLLAAPEDLQRRMRATSQREGDGRPTCQNHTVGSHPKPVAPCKKYPLFQCNICKVLLCPDHCNYHLHAVSLLVPEPTPVIDEPSAPTDAEVSEALQSLENDEGEDEI